ncbi:MAG: hypothetical protein CO156_05910 [Candidatus Pacebacteria bacterium CG_4_9_14_3_um_filter_40_12]|nr:MAG: hypothetical protein COU64_01740 [Candidatus Pacebacteria bacterium CG10_big_fil_rev_8_21_14_0_10_40_26]PIZ78652.1 MAG: hypothetical protein COY01_03405 [Candidatus Pacebacteria bacterium CG_4_10_14_0_2_um_filter_40_20]PJA68496.1 MAG: hypothetical protein CO156_05910 [Candidatus Pacebacteria bacterium CG_4_9_14_3_um_filter_40_12]PJC41875.1 MAG: hypothetical protein CO041_04105 [Candidatus Pacebacteria bacterium CG_4_9_14_0_2_um_filter_40_15]
MEVQKKKMKNKVVSFFSEGHGYYLSIILLLLVIIPLASGFYVHLLFDVRWLEIATVVAVCLLPIVAFAVAMTSSIAQMGDADMLWIIPIYKWMLFISTPLGFGAMLVYVLLGDILAVFPIALFMFVEYGIAYVVTRIKLVEDKQFWVWYKVSTAVIVCTSVLVAYFGNELYFTIAIIFLFMSTSEVVRIFQENNKPK